VETERRESTVAKFIVPHWGGKSQLWHRVVVPARQATITQAGGPVRQPYAGVNYILHTGTLNLATGSSLSLVMLGRGCSLLIILWVAGIARGGVTCVDTGQGVY
jgi:hypothetical protein